MLPAACLQGAKFYYGYLGAYMYPTITLFGKTFGTYGLLMAAAVFLVLFLAKRRGKRIDLSFYDILIVGFTAVGIGLVGGMLLFVFVTYPLDLIIEMISQGNFEFLNGGIVFYGGLIGGILGAFLGLKIAKCKFEAVEYAIVPLIPLGHAIGRVGCVMAGCCYGFEYDGPCAIYYANALTGLSPEQGYFPIQPMESLLNLVICVILLLYTKKQRRRYDVLFTYLGCYAVARFILEIFRGDAVRGIYFSISLSQWISIGMLAITALWFFVFRPLAVKKEKSSAE